MLAVIAASAAGAQAQRPGSVRPDSLPPLADTLYLYGGPLPTTFDEPTLAPPRGALALSLNEAVRLALARNPGVAIAELEAERAANDVTRGNAGYLPTLDAGATFGGSRVTSGGTGGSDSTGGGSSTVARTSAAGDLTLGYTVFDGGRRRATYRRLEAEARQFGVLAEAEAEETAFAVTAAYLDVIRQEGVGRALAEAVDISEDRLRIEAAEVEIGTAAPIDAALALADLNADRAALLRQALALNEARAALGALLALPTPEAVEATDALTLGRTPDVAGLTEAAARENRRVRALALAEVAAREVIREERAARYPTVRVATGVGVSALDNGLFTPVSPGFGTDFRYGFTASLPLFDGGERRRRTENARLRLRQAELQTDDERINLRADLARLAASVAGYRQLSELEEGSRAVARQNVRVALAQFQLGLITPIDLRQVQLTLIDAEVRLVDAVYLARRAEAELRLLAGDLLPPGGGLATGTAAGP